MGPWGPLMPTPGSGLRARGSSSCVINATLPYTFAGDSRRQILDSLLILSFLVKAYFPIATPLSITYFAFVTSDFIPHKSLTYKSNFKFKELIIPSSLWISLSLRPLSFPLVNNSLQNIFRS